MHVFWMFLPFCHCLSISVCVWLRILCVLSHFDCRLWFIVYVAFIFYKIISAISTSSSVAFCFASASAFIHSHIFWIGPSDRSDFERIVWLWLCILWFKCVGVCVNDNLFFFFHYIKWAFVLIYVISCGFFFISILIGCMWCVFDLNGSIIGWFFDILIVCFVYFRLNDFANLLW